MLNFNAGSICSCQANKVNISFLTSVIGVRSRGEHLPLRLPLLAREATLLRGLVADVRACLRTLAAVAAGRARPDAALRAHMAALSRDAVPGGWRTRCESGGERPPAGTPSLTEWAADVGRRRAALASLLSQPQALGTSLALYCIAGLWSLHVLICKRRWATGWRRCTRFFCREALEGTRDLRKALPRGGLA